jgi:hypothetical protein
MADGRRISNTRYRLLCLIKNHIFAAELVIEIKIVNKCLSDTYRRFSLLCCLAFFI